MSADDTERSGPVVSILLPSYNHARYVEEAIRSIWAQTYPHVELVVVDDGSRDESPDIIRRLAAESPIPMRVLIKENEGVARTLNRAFALASGKYIGFFASDDRLLPNHVATLVEVLEHAPADVAIAYGDVYALDAQGRRADRLLRGTDPRSGRIFEDLLLRRFMFSGLAALMRSEVFRAVGGYNERSRLDDWELFVRATREHSVVYVDEVLAEYREHAGPRLNQQVDRFVPDWLRVFDEATRDYPPARTRAWMQRARAHTYHYIGHHYYNVRDMPNARRWFRRSVAAFPLHGRTWNLLLRASLGRAVVERASALMGRFRRPLPGAE